MRADIQTGFAEVNGTSLYYELAGEGEPVVLIHGFTLDARMWDDQFLEFSRRHLVLRYDLRGYGRSAKPLGEDYTDADDLMSLMKRFGFGRAHIIGLSMGGSIATDFALSYPEGVDKLVLVDAALSGHAFTKDYGSAMRSLRTTCLTQGLDAAKAQFLGFEMFCTESENPKVHSRLKKIIDDYSGIHLLYGFPTSRIKTKDPPVAQRLSDIHVPTLVIMGEHDSRDFHIIADLLVRDIPQARKLVIPNVRHMSNMEDPETFNREVLDFLPS